MQREGGLLMKRNHRPAMAIVMAIVFIVIIATIGALSLRLVSQTTKTTTDIYLYEQAAIYAKSAAEIALLDIAQNGPCTTSFPSLSEIDSLYNVTVDVKYIYKGLSCNGGTNDYLTTPITTDEQNGSVVMDITVEVNASSTGSEPIRYFRRTIQKL